MLCDDVYFLFATPKIMAKYGIAFTFQKIMGELLSVSADSSGCLQHKNSFRKYTCKKHKKETLLQEVYFVMRLILKMKLLPCPILPHYLYPKTNIKTAFIWYINQKQPFFEQKTYNTEKIKPIFWYYKKKRFILWNTMR